MKKFLFLYLLVSLVFSDTGIAQQSPPTVLFAVRKGLADTSRFVAVPFVWYMNGKYHDIPVCESKATEEKAIDECFEAIGLLVPIITIQKELVVLKNGTQTGTTNIASITEYGFSDWVTFSGILQEDPNAPLLTNNPDIGLTELKKIISTPMLVPRKSPEGYELEDELLTKVDIDGDGVPELIYLCGDYEGTFYQIFSYKNSQWKKVFEGGYQGL